MEDFGPVVEDRKEGVGLWGDVGDARKSRLEKTLKLEVNRYDVQQEIN